MNPLHLILTPTGRGWAVCLTDGQAVARFRGPGSKWRALRYLPAPRRPSNPSCRQNVDTPQGAASRPTSRHGMARRRVGVHRPRLASNRPRVPRRLAVALLLLGIVLPLLAPSRSLASSLIARRQAHARGPQSHHPRRDQVPTHPAAAAPRQPDVRSTADDASVPVLLVLVLNSAVMLIRVASPPPSWIKD